MEQNKDGAAVHTKLQSFAAKHLAPFRKRAQTGTAKVTFSSNLAPA
jgi:hypothetical protein